MNLRSRADTCEMRTDWTSIAGACADPVCYVSSGAVVFVTQSFIRSHNRVTNGFAVGNTIILSENNPPHFDETWAHERGHILQWDFFYGAIGLPLEEWLGGRLGRHVQSIQRRANLGFTRPFLGSALLETCRCSWMTCSVLTSSRCSMPTTGRSRARGTRPKLWGSTRARCTHE